MTQWTEEVDPVRGDFRVQLRVETVLFEGQTEHQHVLLFENGTYGKVLLFDGVAQFTERDEFIYHEMLVHVPALAHGAVESALIVGGGDGGATQELFKHPSLKRVVLVEIDRQVVDVARTHLRSVCGDAFEDPRLELVIDDGVAYATRCQERFDLILIDSADPSGSADVLYGEPFYRDLKRLLAPGGVLVTQNALPFFNKDWLAKPLARLRKYYADVRCYLASVPSFYGGFMAYGWASDIADLRRVPPEILAERAQAIGLATRYYTPEIHVGAFALPPYVKAMLPR